MFVPSKHEDVYQQILSENMEEEDSSISSVSSKIAFYFFFALLGQK